MSMKIVTCNLPEPFITAMEKLISEYGLYPSRSELIRVAVREFLIKELKVLDRFNEYSEIDPDSTFEWQAWMDAPARAQNLDMRTIRNYHNLRGLSPSSHGYPKPVAKPAPAPKLVPAPAPKFVPAPETERDPRNQGESATKLAARGIQSANNLEDDILGAMCPEEADFRTIEELSAAVGRSTRVTGQSFRELEARGLVARNALHLIITPTGRSRAARLPAPSQQ